MKSTVTSSSARHRANTARGTKALPGAMANDEYDLPIGFTGQELRNAAIDAGVAVSPTKFTQIVRAAGLGPLPHGGAGSHYRFTNAEVDALAYAARHGGRDVHRPRRFRHGSDISAIWLRLTSGEPRI